MREPRDVLPVARRVFWVLCPGPEGAEHQPEQK